jgi:2-hydroxychromene-2-carboxylate isomerase
MAKTIDYYFTPGSPWSYFGHDRFAAIAARHGATVNVLPVDLGKVFPVSGGLPLPKRAPQRQAYRLVELARWRDFLGLPINVQPKFAASGADLANRWILAATETGWKPALDLAGAVMRGRWAGERDIADPATLAEFARGAGLDPAAVAARADAPEIAARFDAITAQAIDAQVFGVPWYVYAGEPFWGQDRLDFLDRALAK